MNEIHDIIIIGAGAAGLFAGVELANKGRKCLILEKEHKAGRKLLITGGGKCNFSNLNISPNNYTSQNPHFVKSALARFKTEVFIRYLEKHNIEYEIRDEDKLFTKKGADLIVRAFLNDIQNSECEIKYETTVNKIELSNEGYRIECKNQLYYAKNIIIASGSPSTKNYNSSFHRYLAKDLDLEFINEEPALTPLLIDEMRYTAWSELSGIVIKVKLQIGKKIIKDAMLFTRNGVSGPAILNASLYWKNSADLSIDFLPNLDLFNLLIENRKRNISSKNFISNYLPKRVVENLIFDEINSKPLCHYNEKELLEIADRTKNFKLSIKSKAGFEKAETVIGGISTNEISSKTMESNKYKGLYIIGESLDVAGELGGYNLHWAWASAHACISSL